MPYLITLDESGKEVEKLAIEPSFVPINNYEKQRNGDYVRIVNDPRIIPDPKPEVKTIKSPPLLPPPPFVGDKKHNTKYLYENNGIQNLFCTDPIKLNDILKLCSSKTFSRSAKKIYMTRVFDIQNGLGFSELEKYNLLEKITIDLVEKSLSVWLIDKSSSMADIVIQNAVRK